jgi:hypothetical protein
MKRILGGKDINNVIALLNFKISAKATLTNGFLLNLSG